MTLGHAAPYQLFAVRTIEIQNQRARRIVPNLRSSSAEAAPTPTAQSVIKRLIFPLVVGAADGRDRIVTAIIYTLPTLGLQFPVDGILNPALPKRVGDFSSLPNS